MSKQFRLFLSAFQLAIGINSENTKNCRAVVNHLLKGINVRSTDMCFLNGDNIGFLIVGLAAAYDSWIMFQDIIIREARLIQLKIHTVDSNDDSRLSREPTFDWLKLAEEDSKKDPPTPTLAEDILSITEDDIQLLSNSVMEHIHYGMEVVKGNKMQVGEAILRPGYFISHETRVDFETTQHKHPEEREHCINETADVVNRRIPRLSTTREGDRVNGGSGEDNTYLPGLNHAASLTSK